MIILFILGLLLGAVAVVFALQNITVITVSFFSWSITGSLSVIVLLAIGVGILVALLLFLPSSVQGHFRYRRLKKANSKLEEELRKQKELTVFAKEVPPSRENLAKIEDGASEEHSS